MVILRDTMCTDTGSSSSKDGCKRKSFFSQPQGTMEYRVMARDTLDSIALSFESTPSQLTRLNHLSSRMLFPGQVLYVPDPDAEVPLSPTCTSPTSTIPEPPKKLDIPTISMKPKGTDVPTVSQAPPSVTKKHRIGSGRSFSFRRSFTREHNEERSRPPLQKAVSEPRPGYPIRKNSVEWDSEDSKQYLKLDVKYITDGEGVVSGTMLVTPNAIMFDPNVSDPLVKDRGAGPYGVMTNMDQVLGAAMYHDISAMSLKTQTSTEEREKPCCPVYVPEKSERRVKETIAEEDVSNSSKEGKNAVILAQDIRQRLKGCSDDTLEKGSVDHSSDETATKDPQEHLHTSGTEDTAEVESVNENERTKESDVVAMETKLSTSDSVEGDVDSVPLDNAAKLKPDTANNEIESVASEQVDVEKADVSLEEEVEEPQSDSQKEQSTEDDEDKLDDSSPTSLGYQLLPSPTESDQGTKRLSDETMDDEMMSKAAKRSEDSEEKEGGDGDERQRRRSTAGSDLSADSGNFCEMVDREMDERLREIEMLLNSSDDRMDDSCQIEEQSPAGYDDGGDDDDDDGGGDDGSVAQATSQECPVTEDEHKAGLVNPKDDETIVESGTGVLSEDENPMQDLTSDDCSSACGRPGDPCSQSTPENMHQGQATCSHADKQDFVNFSSGIFVTDCRKCSLVPDMEECIHNREESMQTLEEIREGGRLMRHLSDEDKSSSTSQESKEQTGKEALLNGESNNNACSEVDATDGGTGEKATAVPVNKPPSREMEYNRTNFREFLPKRAKPYEDPPLYLCLRTKKPMQKTFSVIQANKFKKNKVPEYWFAIPKIKADNLYAFFLQWSPDVYGKEVSPSEVGFVVVQDSQEVEELELIEDFFKEPIHKDWEIITREEASKRRMTILECEMNLPLPELIGESTLLCNDYVRKLAKQLPARTEGYSWSLVFSTSSHGYSLHSLYRNMASWESPILLILRDSEGRLFGALTSCALRVSDHYYGTGETFLFRFHEEELEMFRWTGENNFFMKGDLDAVCIGGGEGDFGLWLDGDLYHGRSHACKTFGNETLSSKEDFIIADMEAWGFTM